MKRIIMTVAGMSMALAVLFTCFSCAKKEGVSTNTVKKEELKITPEQAKRLGEIKKGVVESKNIVVARVNGAEITVYFLVREMNAIAPKFVAHGQPTTPELTTKIKKEALNNLIFKELAVQKAINEGIRIKPEAVEDVISKMKAQAGSDEAYKKYLEQINVNEDDLRKIIERSRLFESITAMEIYEKIKVDDKALRAAYEKEKATLMTKDNPPRQLSFEMTKEFLARKIKSEKSGKRREEWNNELRKNAKIEIVSERATNN